MKIPIKCILLYFSQVVTGNTKKIAEKIAEGIRHDGNSCELLHLRKYESDLAMIKKINFHDFDLFGLGVPVYYFHPPYHVLFELERYPSMKGLKAFLFCTSGGNPGSTLHQLKVALNAKGAKIIAGEDKWIGWDVHQMYNNFGGYLPSSFGHPDEKELEQAVEFGKKVVKTCMDPSSPEKMFWDKENPSARMWSYEGMQGWFPKFHLNQEACTRCGYCAEVCPVDSIVLDPYPRWTKDCDRCYICDLKCPERAIVCDFTDQIAYLEGLMKKRKD